MAVSYHSGLESLKVIRITPDMPVGACGIPLNFTPAACWALIYPVRPVKEVQ